MSRRKKKQTAEPVNLPTSPTEDRVEADEEAPPESVQAVPLKIESESAEEESLLEQLQRLQAEFSNYRKRTLRERSEWDKRAKGGVLSSLLVILDDLARARESIGSDPKSNDVEGLLLVFSRLEESLRSLGLKQQPVTPGTPFDPNHHEAMLTEASEEHAEGTIVGILQPGYLFDDLLLRPARVRVSSGPGEPEGAADARELPADREDSSTTAGASKETGPS